MFVHFFYRYLHFTHCKFVFRVYTFVINARMNYNLSTFFCELCKILKESMVISPVAILVLNLFHLALPVKIVQITVFNLYTIFRDFQLKLFLIYYEINMN